ncbi:MAG TPA: thiamine phosphate synthase [Xanthobacteraceae bacterium]|nr:thiamine phosphate synthase [Xanthobacteraceae bacterium]
MKPDLRLNAILDPQRSGGLALPDLARRVVDGGATLLQLRDKTGGTRRMVEEARAIMAAVEGRGVPLVINDRVDVALAAGAAGVHVGWDDMDARDARRLLGPGAMIGLSINSPGRAETGPLEAVDYVGIGGVFATLSKDNPNKPIGVEGLARLIAIVRARRPGLPVVAIAGIDPTNAGAVMTTEADGVAVISALSLAPDPTEAARTLRGIVDGALARRAPR